MNLLPQKIRYRTTLQWSNFRLEFNLCYYVCRNPIIVESEQLIFVWWIKIHFCKIVICNIMQMNAFLIWRHFFEKCIWYGKNNRNFVSVVYYWPQLSHYLFVYARYKAAALHANAIIFNIFLNIAVGYFISFNCAVENRHFRYNLNVISNQY